MTKREPWIVVILGFVTCGFYLLWWQYVTTDELKRVAGRDDLNPVLDLLLGFITCGLWGAFVSYRNAQIVHTCFVQRSMPHDDKSTLVILLIVAAVFNGFTALLAPMILQDEYNKLTERLGAPPPAAF